MVFANSSVLVVPRLPHRQAVLAMVAAAALWSVAGVVTRQLESARGFEITFWRSACNALALALLLSAWCSPGWVARTLARGGRALWLSGLCWCVMYTAFMVALTLTTVANVLVTMALAPLFTAIIARVTLGHRMARRTWWAIGGAALGITWMYAAQFSAAEPRHLLGTAVALAVPLAAATNWTLLQYLNRRATPRQAAAAPGAAASGPPVTGAPSAAPASPAPAASGAAESAAPPGEPVNSSEAGAMLCAVLLGALLSAALTLPLAWPLTAGARDIGWLGLLGCVQLAVPCLLAVVAARGLSAPEASLLAMLEVPLGVAWAWLGAGEAPQTATLLGGSLVLIVLALHEVPALAKRF